MTPRRSLQQPLTLAWPLQLPDVVLMTKLRIPGHQIIARYPIYCAILLTIITIYKCSASFYNYLLVLFIQTNKHVYQIFYLVLKVLRISTKENTVCRCSGTTFSSTFVVPLNTIDFANVWGKFDPANAAVYGTLIAFLVVYVIAALYLRRQDKKDEEKVKKKNPQ